VLRNNLLHGQDSGKRLESYPFLHAEGGFGAFQLTFRVAEPDGLARRLPRKRRDGPRVGRKERSDWSRQRGVM